MAFFAVLAAIVFAAIAFGIGFVIGARMARRATQEILRRYTMSADWCVVPSKVVEAL